MIQLRFSSFKNSIETFRKTLPIPEQRSEEKWNDREEEASPRGREAIN